MRAMACRGPYRVRVEEDPRSCGPRFSCAQAILANCHDVNARAVGGIHGYDGPIPHSVRFGDATNKGLTLRMNQCPVQRQWPRLFEHVRNGYLRHRELVTHRITLENIAEGYHLFSSKLGDCIKPLIVPNAA